MLAAVARLTCMAMVACAGVLASCTMFDPDNRRTLNWLDANLTPTAHAGRMALLPLSIPVGFVALSADAIIVHPVLVIDDAWGDTVELLWTPDDDESLLRQALFSPFAAVATPFVFAGDWLWRSVFPVDPREADA